MPIHVSVATPDHWRDLVTVFGRRGDDPSWCWCQRFLCPGTDEPDAIESRPNNRDALYDEITQSAVPPGLIAYVDDQPGGWTRVGPRSQFPGVLNNRALAKILTDDDGTWWVTCFVVNSRHRRSGVGLALLNSAVQFAREHGATAVEGHPVDVARLRARRVGGSAIFTGTVAMFSAAGFSEVARTYRTRPLMSLRP